MSPLPSEERNVPIDPGASALGSADADGMHDLDEVADLRRMTPWLVVVLLFVIVAGVTDLLLDAPRNWRSGHVLFEVAVIGVSLGFAVVLWRGWRRTAGALGRAQAALASTTRSLAERQSERDAWRRTAEAERASFGRAIDAQFAAWGLTATEREVASLLLQGLGHKQIAARTGRSERTVRQHAVAVYSKSGISGRAELAAFFLQELLPPSGDHNHPTAS